MTSLAPCLELSHSAPAGVRDLVWDVFFASRGRGIDLQTHCPWLSAATGTHCISLAAGGHTLAALFIRERQVPGAGVIGLIGLVCVRESSRGQGLSRQLLKAAIDLAQNQGMSDLILWTTKPAVYETAGFAPDNQDAFVQVSTRPGAKVQTTSAADAVQRQPFANGIALPAFATSAWRWTSADAHLVVLEGASGITLADWSGPEDAVMDLMDTALPARWSVNLPTEDPLLTALGRHGHRCAAQPGAWRMRLHLGSGPAAPIPTIPLLERI